MADTKADVESLRKKYSEFTLKQLYRLSESPDLHPVGIVLIDAELRKRGESTRHPHKILLESLLAAIAAMIAQQICPVSYSFLGFLLLGLLIFGLLNGVVKGVITVKRRFRKKPATSMGECPNCHAVNPSQSGFCLDCGMCVSFPKDRTAQATQLTP